MIYVFSSYGDLSNKYILGTYTSVSFNGEWGIIDKSSRKR